LKKAGKKPAITVVANAEFAQSYKAQEITRREEDLESSFKVYPYSRFQAQGARFKIQGSIFKI